MDDAVDVQFDGAQGVKAVGLECLLAELRLDGLDFINVNFVEAFVGKSLDFLILDVHHFSALLIEVSVLGGQIFKPILPDVETLDFLPENIVS